MIPIMPPHYPFHAFHFKEQNAMQEVFQHVKAPDALVGMAFLTTMSATCQGLFDVRLPTGQVCPLSLNIAVIADSGERKTAVDNLVSAPIYTHDELRIKNYETDIKEYLTELRLWKGVDVGMFRDITKATLNGESVDDLREKLKKHTETKPVKPRLRRMMRHNATERAIMDALEGDGESIAFMSDEGEIILKGGAMGQTGLRNKGWDGARMLVFDRADGENIIARNPRVTIGFMVQQAVFGAYIDSHGIVTRGSGHWARYLMGRPASTQGMRFMNHLDTVWVHLPVFHARVTELLEKYGRRIDSGKIERTIVEFSDEAKARWVGMVNVTESMLQPCGYLNDIKDFASKSMEIVGRVAGIFHCFSKQEGKISVDTLERALVIVEWHLHEFKRIFSSESSVPQVQIDAQVLERYLHSKYWCNGYSIAPKNDVLRNGPVRPRQRFDAALDFIRSMNRVWTTADLKRYQYINLQQQYFGTMQRV